MYCFIKAAVLTFGLACPLFTIASATESSANTGSWGADISLTSQRQDYDDANAQQHSLQFKPYFATGLWTFQLAIPFIATEGDYFSNGAFPRYRNLCTRLLNSSDRLQRYLIANGRISEEQVENCQSNLETMPQTDRTTASGMGDITAMATYGWYVGSASHAFITTGFIADTGDYAEGLGSGARQVVFESGWATVWPKWLTHLSAGYTLVDATEALDELNNYAYLGAGADYDLTTYWQLGAQLRWEQPYFNGSDTIYTLTLSSGWDLTKNSRTSVYATTYLHGVDYPNSEIGASLSFHF